MQRDSFPDHQNCAWCQTETENKIGLFLFSAWGLEFPVKTLKQIKATNNNRERRERERARRTAPILLRQIGELLSVRRLRAANP